MLATLMVGLALLPPGSAATSSPLERDSHSPIVQSQLRQTPAAGTGPTATPSLADRLLDDNGPTAAGSFRPRPGEAPLPTATPLPPRIQTPLPPGPPERRRTRERTRERALGRGSAALASVRVWPLKPASYEVSQPFGCVPALLGYYPVTPGCPSGAPAYHSGLDLAAPAGTPIYAAAAGWVTYVGADAASGVANPRIVIQHDGANMGYATEYYHWQQAFVQVGDYVEAGDEIAKVGSVGYSTGPHLHFSVVDFEREEQLDPITWLPASSATDLYAGRLPNRAGVTFGETSVAVPDYANPAPPPLPVAQEVPAAPAGDATGNGPVESAAVEPATGDREDPATVAADQSDTAGEPAVATAAATAAPTAYVDQARDAGESNNGESAPMPTAVPSNPFNPSLAGVPLNPMVQTPPPADEPDKKADKRDRKR